MSSRLRNTAWEWRKSRISFFTFTLLVLMLPPGCESFSRGESYTALPGAYSCQENSAHSGYRKYLVEIDKVKTQENVYIISNFHNLGDGEFLYARLGNDTLLIENQVISGIFINGTGVVNPEFNRLELFYQTDDGSIRLEFFAVYSR